MTWTFCLSHSSTFIWILTGHSALMKPQRMSTCWEKLFENYALVRSFLLANNWIVYDQYKQAHYCKRISVIQYLIASYNRLTCFLICECWQVLYHRFQDLENPKWHWDRVYLHIILFEELWKDRPLNWKRYLKIKNPNILISDLMTYFLCCDLWEHLLSQLKKNIEGVECFQSHVRITVQLSHTLHCPEPSLFLMFIIASGGTLSR